MEADNDNVREGIESCLLFSSLYVISRMRPTAGTSPLGRNIVVMLRIISCTTIATQTEEMRAG